MPQDEAAAPPPTTLKSRFMAAPIAPKDDDDAKRVHDAILEVVNDVQYAKAQFIAPIWHAILLTRIDGEIDELEKRVAAMGRSISTEKEAARSEIYKLKQFATWDLQRRFYHLLLFYLKGDLYLEKNSKKKFKKGA